MYSIEMPRKPTAKQLEKQNMQKAVIDGLDKWTLYRVKDYNKFHGYPNTLEELYSSYQHLIVKPKIREARALKRKQVRQQKKAFQKAMGEIKDKIKERFNDRLRKSLIIFNEPENYEELNRTLLTTPLLRNSVEKQIQTYYFTGLTSVEDIKRKLKDLYRQQTDAFKVTLSFGFIFEVVQTKMVLDENEDLIPDEEFYTYVVFRPSNVIFFTEGVLIRNKSDFKSMTDGITFEELQNYISKCRPSSAHKIIGIYSMGVKIMKMDKKIGSTITIPDYVAKNQNFVNPDSSYNKCFWVCSAYDETKNKRCVSRANELYEAFYGKQPTRDYLGFNYLTELDDYEKFSNKEYNIFEPVNVRDDGGILQKFDLELIRQSHFDDDIDTRHKINLLLIDTHFVYISRLDVFEKTKYCCQNCGHCSNDLKDLKKHIKACENFDHRDVFPSSPEIYEPPRNKILELNDEFDLECDFKFHPIIVYDFESLCLSSNHQMSERFKTNNEQRAVSVSLCSNIEGFQKPIFIENENPNILFQKMFQNLDDMVKVGINQMKKQMKPMYDVIFKMTDPKRKKHYLRIIGDYCESVPVLGFNSGKYDINLDFKTFIKEVKQRGEIKLTIKNGNSFKALKSDNFLFLDICQYLPPGYNLDSYIQAFNKGGLKKSIFPYEFLDSYEKLEYDINILTKEHFYSSLKNKDITDEEFKEFLTNKEKYSWKTIRDLLKFYNNLDVQPFLDAVVNHRKFFYELGYDMFKDGFSLPGLAEKIMFGFQFKEFNEEFIYQKIPYKKSYERGGKITNWTVKQKNYMQQDKDKKRYDAKCFIQYPEVSELISSQSCKCLYCWKDLINTDWSLDRLDNSLGHNSGNCVLSCINCNITRKDENFKKFYRKSALLRYAKTHPMIHLIDEENKIVFEKLKKNICGGPSVVFHRYHEADETQIKRPIYENGNWKEGKEGKVVKNITGFDANALYLWCIGNEMPCGKLSYTETDSSYSELQNIYGFIEVDIYTPENLFNKFGEFPLVFKNAEFDINKEAGETMNGIFNQFDNKESRMTKKLISSFKGDKVLIKSDRLKWMVEQGLVVTKVYGYIECEKGQPFQKFMDKVSDERRKGDIDPEHGIIAEMWKLVGNSAFGRTGMNKSKFTKTIYGDEKKYYKEIGSILFKDANQYGDIFEITKATRTTRQNIPIQVACSIYDDAKFLMSQFYYDCIDKFIEREDFQYIEMDTDSAYMALTDDFEKLIKPSMLDIWNQEKHKWFMREDTKANKAFDKRKPGLFKPEFIGKGIVALSSKMYYVKGFDTKDKCSCKGVQKNNNTSIINYEKYKNIVLGINKSENVKNKGMRILNSNQTNKENNETKQNRTIYTYEVEKLGLTNRYDKRIVLSDLVSTVPLNI